MSTTLSALLAFGSVPCTATAAQTTTSSEIAAAYEELIDLRAKVEMYNNDLITARVALAQTQQRIDELDVQIADSTNRLSIAKQRLSTFVAEDYKYGHISLLDIVLKSASIDELVTNIVVANKVATLLRENINAVNSLNTTLLTQRLEMEQAQKEQQEHYAAKEKCLADTTAATERAEAYYNQLTAEQRRQIDEQERMQRAAAAAASLQQLVNLASRQEAASQSVTYDDGGAYTPDAEGGQEGDFVAPTYGVPSSGAPSYTDLSEDDVQQLLADVTASLGSEAAATLANSGGDYSSLVSAAMGMLGSGYQYSGYTDTGDVATSAYTCSGMVDAALGRPSQSSSPESLYDEVGSNMTKDIGALNEGDLVFYSYGDREVGHVGVYIGDGQIIDSAPNGGVAVRDVDYMDFVGGGSL